MQSTSAIKYQPVERSQKFFEQPVSLSAQNCTRASS